MSSPKRHKRQKPKKHCQLEPLFQGVKAALIRDLADDHYIRLFSKLERGADIPPINDGCPPYPFKKLKQLLDFDKRIIWTSDKPFEALADADFLAFKESQSKFHCPEPLSRRAYLVIQEASRICHEILGEFDYDEWFDSCSFGKRAATGLPRSKSYLDKRLECLSGTEMQWAAFRHAMSRDVHLFRAVRKRRRNLNIVNAVKAAAVPKSWKAARIMFPDTVLGGFLSRGLGHVIRNRLERNTSIDLARQQDRHKAWAREASVTGLRATLDMSKASDSYVWRHIELLVHQSWHHALDVVRCRQCELPSGEVIELKSYMLMGSGHTFPLQTLLFYCLSEAVRSLLKCSGKVSVYGDDIIVPTRMSHQLIVVLSELGFTINSAKSFFDGPDPDRPSHTFFRESCGGDYKGGVDVRPYMPEHDCQLDGLVTKNHYVAWCHKILNGLLDHWDQEEIPSAVLYLVSRIAESANGTLCFVPVWEVDHAGIRHDLNQFFTYGLNRCGVRYVQSHPTYVRLVLRKRKRRRGTDERPYLWHAYWLQRHPKAASTEWDPYSSAISLSGESLKDDEGVYRWAQFGNLGK